MYCNSCGKEIPEGAKFCPKCGAPAGQTEAAPALTQVPRPAISYSDLTAKLSGITGDRKKLMTYLYIAAAVIFVLLGILIHGKLYSFSAPALGYEADEAFTIAEFESLSGANEGGTGVLVFLTLLNLGAAALCVLPVVQGTVGKARFHIYQFIVAVFSMFMVYADIAFNADHLKQYGVDFKLAGRGVFFMLLSVVVIAVLAYITVKNRSDAAKQSSVGN